MNTDGIYLLAQKFLASPAFRYLIVGAVTNLVLVSLYAALTFLSVHEITASSICYGIGIGITYTLNKGWSFRDQSAHRTTFIKYIAAYCSGYVVQVSVLYGLAFEFGLPHFFAQVIGMGAATLSIFLLLTFFVFKPMRDPVER